MIHTEKVSHLLLCVYTKSLYACSELIICVELVCRGAKFEFDNA